MSTPPPFHHSSPFTPSRPRKSKFTYKQLHQLRSYSTTCPLRVIAHIDLDAFYAQCEMVRLSVPPDQPLAVQQWQGLIAVNYPARAAGVTRFLPISEAAKACPNLIMQHVATWREGEEKWAYRPDAAQGIAVQKVSLDPYRLESRKILKVIRETLPQGPMQKVEKASIDEVFVDLSAQIHGELLKRYAFLDGPPPYDDPSERLPRPPTTALDWDTDALVDLDDAETEDDDPDWDDICTLIGSEIVRDLRARIYAELKYTCSAGISRNKMLAKLGSSHKKPNAQTVVRNRAVQQFLSGHKFTKIRNLGGKLGDEVVAMFNTDTVKDLLDVPLEQLKRLGDDTGQWLYGVVRGEDTSEVNSRTQIKSMLSAKSFRPAINAFDSAVRWLRIFVADIFSRCVEEGVLENKRKPKTINLHHRQGAQTRSRQAPIPQGRMLTEEGLFELAKNLLAQVVVDGRAWPCSNLSLSVGGFEDGVQGNKGIGGFLVRGEEAKAMMSQDREGSMSRLERDSHLPPDKRRRIDTGGIQKFFASRDDSRGDSEQEQVVELGQELEDAGEEGDLYAAAPDQENGTTPRQASSDAHPPPPREHYDSEPLPPDILPPSNQNAFLDRSSTPPQQQSIEKYLCPRCSASVPSIERAEHEDYHYAKDLADEMRQQDRQAAAPATPRPTATAIKSSSAGGKGRGRPTSNGGGGKGVEKGQQRLAFGK